MTPALPTTHAELVALLDAVEARVRRQALADGMDIQQKAHAAAFALFEPLVRKAFDPNEPRGADGRWGSGGVVRDNSRTADASRTTPHPDHHAHAAHVVEGLPEKLPVGVWAKVGDKCLTAAAKVYTAMLKATPAALKAMQGLDALLTTGDDLKKFGYEPMGATSSADALKLHTGVSSQVAATIASHVLGRAYVYAKSKLRPEVRKAFGLDGWAVTKGYDPDEARDDGGKWTAGGGGGSDNSPDDDPDEDRPVRRRNGKVSADDAEACRTGGCGEFARRLYDLAGGTFGLRYDKEGIPVHAAVKIDGRWVHFGDDEYDDELVEVSEEEFENARKYDFDADRTGLNSADFDEIADIVAKDLGYH